MKYKYILLIIVFAISCSDSEDIFEENFTRGGFAQFSEDLETSRFNALTFDEVSFSAEVIDPNNNVQSYALTLIYGDIVVDNFIVLNSLPGTVQFTGQEILSSLNLSLNELDIATSLQFVATITTPDGIFSGSRPSFDSAANVVTGGDTANDIFSSAVRQAVDFSFSFFLPPPKKFRGTSFEEPFGTGAGFDYTRPDADADLTAELLNNSGERHVMHTASGTGTDDEIGFRTFFESTGDGGFTTEEIGVSTATEEVGAYIDGAQGYQLEDVDGLLRIVFDKVEIDPVANPSSGVQIQFFPRDTGWEDDDTLVISVVLERGDGSEETVELLNVLGDQDIEDGGLIGKWNLVDTGFLDNIAAYTLIIEAVVDSGNEDIYFDQMLVYIPE